MKKILHYNIILKPEVEGGFTVIVPSLPGCVTYGKDLNEAKKMAVDAIGGYIVSLKKHNEFVPNDKENFLASVELPIYA
ncbi:MAG: type II toxin-antitoxin system HicB family antitoxin [Parcubacteria group bacterium]|nr:type II toxin-antitoxin system HicB family antitoxin [Parcubacteria group bacterium]